MRLPRELMKLGTLIHIFFTALGLGVLLLRNFISRTDIVCALRPSRSPTASLTLPETAIDDKNCRLGPAGNMLIIISSWRFQRCQHDVSVNLCPDAILEGFLARQMPRTGPTAIACLGSRDLCSSGTAYPHDII